MKKCWPIYLIAFTFFLVSCQKNPDEGIISGKNLERMLEMSYYSDEEAQSFTTLIERCAAPSTYDYKSVEAQGAITINVNAAVILPPAEKIPIVRITAADFTQEQVTGMFSTLCGDTPMWNTLDASKDLTKNAITEEIRSLNKLLSNEEYLASRTEELVALDKKRIDYLLSIYDAAPESFVRTRCYGELELQEQVSDVTHRHLYDFWGMSAMSMSAPTKFFYIANNSNVTEYKKVESNIVSPGKNAIARFQVFSDSDGANYDQWIEIETTDQPPTEAEALNLAITPAQAAQLASDFIRGAGLQNEMSIERIYLMKAEENQPKGAYAILGVRRVNNIPVAYVSGNSTGEGFAEYWSYEKMEICIGNEGIYRFAWSSPLNVRETINENAKLLPFSKIANIFERFVGIKYGSAYAKSADQTRYDIDRITLSLQRISEQNSIENGLLIPVWNFYGTKTDTFDDRGITKEISAPLITSFVTINAVDGSIIDPEAGY